jgi:hypothetical protein
MRVAATSEPIMLLPRCVIIAGCVDGPGAVVCGESVSLRALGWTAWFSGPGRDPSQARMPGCPFFAGPAVAGRW